MSHPSRKSLRGVAMPFSASITRGRAQASAYLERKAVDDSVRVLATGK
jgi:hypothetical protein